MNTRRRLTIAVAFAVSGLFLYLAFRNINFGKVWHHISTIHPGWIALSILAQGCALLAMSGRSKILLGPLHPYSFYRLFKSVLVSFAGNNVLPLRMGEVLRIDYLARFGKIPHSSCLAVVFVERLLDLGWLFILFFGVLPLVMSGKTPSGAALLLPATLISIAIVGALLISRFPTHFLRLVAWGSRFLGDRLGTFVKDKVSLFVDGLSALGSTRSVVAVVLLSGGFWAGHITAVQMWLFAFGIPTAPWSLPGGLCLEPATGCMGVSMAAVLLPWYAPLLIQIFLAFGAALPSSPGFVGTYHYFATVALLSLGISSSVAASFAIVAHAVSIIPYTCLAFLLLFRDFSTITNAVSQSLSGEDWPAVDPQKTSQG